MCALNVRDHTSAIFWAVGAKESHLVCKPVKVGFLYIDRVILPSLRFTKTSINGNFPSDSFSIVNCSDGWSALRTSKNSIAFV